MARRTLKSVVGRIAMLALIGVAASPGLAQMRGGATMGGGMPAMGGPAGGFGGGFGGFGGGFGGRGFGGMNMVRPTAFVGTTPVLPMKVYPYHVPEGGFVNHA